MAAPDSGNRSSSPLTALALGLALAGAASMVYYHLALFMPRVRQVRAAGNLAGGYSFGADFYPIWLTSQECLRGHCDLYSLEMTHAIQKGLFGRPLDTHISTDPLTEYRTFAYPAFTDLLFWPTAKLPFPVVRVVLAPLLAALTLITVLLWAQALSWRFSWTWLVLILLLTLCSYPVLEGLYADQLGLLVGCLLAASILALQRGRLLLAGTLLALTTIKPQMTLLALVYLFVWSMYDWRRRGRFAVGLLSTMLLLAGASLAVWPHWIQSWARVILAYHRYAEPVLAGEVFGAPLGPAAALLLITLLLIAALVLAWQHRAAPSKTLEFWLTLSLLLAITTVTLVPGQAVHDHVILLPGIFLLARLRPKLSSSWIQRALLLTGIAVLLWPWPASFLVIVLRPLLTDQRFYSKAVLGLPLHAAGMFPFLVLGLLALAFRDTSRGRDQSLTVS